MTGPITEDGEAYKAMACVVGDIVLTWADAENALAMAVRMIDEKFGPIAGQADLPRALKRRVDFIKAALRSESRLESVKELGEAVARTFSVLKNDRHQIVHGITRAVHGRQFISVNFDTKGRNAIPKVIHISIEDADAFL